MLTTPPNQIVNPQSKILPLEATRGFAAFVVFLNHSANFGLFNMSIAGHAIPNFGQEAVILFFLLSGFVIQYSFSRKSDQSAKRFFFDRFTRIYIPLIPTLILSYLVASWVAGIWQDEQISTLLANLFMLQDSASLKPGTLAPSYMNNSPLWSLSYEWWFYVGYFLLFISIKSVKTKTLIILVSSLIAAVLYASMPNWFLRVLMYFPMWWIGALAAIHYANSDESAKILPLIWACMSTLIVITAILVIQAQSSIGNTSWGVHPLLEIRHFTSVITIILGLLVWRKMGWVTYKFTLRPFLYIAPISYGFYICHFPFLQLVPLLEVKLGWAASWAIILTSIITFSWFLEIWLFPRGRNVLKKLVFNPNR